MIPGAGAFTYRPLPPFARVSKPVIWSLTLHAQLPTAGSLSLELWIFKEFHAWLSI